MELNERADEAAAPTDAARLFVALWPPAELAAALRERCDSACGDAPAHPVVVARVHLTLHFLGKVPRARLPALQSALCLPFHPFELRFRACERWPRGLVVMAPDAVPPALAALHAGLAQALGALGLRVDHRPLRPHVTLARRQAAPWSATPQTLAPLDWPVQDYVLAESLTGPRSNYRILQTCAAQAAGSQSAPASA